MGNYVLAFRAAKGQMPSPEEEAHSPQWFEKIGGQISDPGNRVGEVRAVGAGSEPSDELSGYIVINAETIDGAAAAKGCPMLLQGGSVEVGELIPAGGAG
jgi:hypothetical protein